MKDDHESRGKGKIGAMPAKSRRKDGRPPKSKIPTTLSNADKLSSGHKTARDRPSSAAPGSILKRSGSRYSDRSRAQSQKKSVIFRDITDIDTNRDKSMASSRDSNSPRPLSGILKNKIPRV